MSVETKVTRIYQANSCGKWMEFWTQPDVEMAWDMCSKACYLWQAVDAAKLDRHVLNRGLIGLHIEWRKTGDNPNWEIGRVFLSDRPSES